jgi:hypothetical protein
MDIREGPLPSGTGNAGRNQDAVSPTIEGNQKAP